MHRDGDIPIPDTKSDSRRPRVLNVFHCRSKETDSFGLFSVGQENDEVCAGQSETGRKKDTSVGKQGLLSRRLWKTSRNFEIRNSKLDEMSKSCVEDIPIRASVRATIIYPL